MRRLAIQLSERAGDAERFAADELGSYLRLICGEEPSLGAGGDSAGGYTFRLAEPDPALGAEGFRVTCGPDACVLTGGGPVGLLYAVYDLLERRLGVRWFYPDPADEVVPRLSVADLLGVMTGADGWEERPAFRLRMLSILHDEQYLDAIDRDALLSWLGKLRINGLQVGWEEVTRASFKALVPALRQRAIRIVAGDHTTYARFLPADRYFADHPDWFALVDGKRQVADKWWRGQQFCTTNPAARETYVANLAQYLRENPEVGGLYLWPNDYGAWCECAGCGRRSVADNLLALNNATARALREAGRDVEVISPAYANHVEPPETVRPEAGVGIAFCGWGRNFRHPWNDPNTNPEHRAFLTRWLATAAESATPVYLHSKLMRLRGIGYQLMPLSVVGQDLRHYRTIGLSGLDFHMALLGWWTKSLNTYVVSKLAWNSAQDEEALLDDYFAQYWGAAHREVRAFYEQIDRAFVHRQYYRVRQNYNLAHAKIEAGEPTFYDPAEASYPPELADYNARVVGMLDQAEQILSAVERRPFPFRVRLRLTRLRRSFDFVRGERESLAWLGRLVALLDEPGGASPDEAERLLARIEEIESDLAARIERDRAEKSGLVWDETHHLGRIGIWRDRVAARRQRPVAVEP